MSRKFLPTNEVLARFGRQRTWLHKQISLGRFPEPVKIGNRNYWDDEVLTDWQDSLVAEAQQRQQARIEAQNAAA